jgi:prephenate dehydrogenase
MEDDNIASSRIAIIGLGLIGGSLARALHDKLGIMDITAVNRTPEAISQAVRDGSIRQGFCELNDHVYYSDIIFICTPVKQALKYLDLLAGKVKPGCIVTDVGSTKGEIASYAESLPNAPCFIGGHPMAGTEKTGYAAGFAHMFENAYYVLTPGRRTTDDALNKMTGIVKGIGAIPVIMDAAKHDIVTAGISHLPHVIASALVNMVSSLDIQDGSMSMHAAGGFKDLTRIASSSPEMWENIVLSNGPRLKELIEYFREVLGDFEKNLEAFDSGEILKFFSNAKDFRDSLSSTAVGLISPACELIVDVVDKPGIIGEIATILGKSNINIKNINVSNSREFEQGCLKITLPDTGSVNIAFDLLAIIGYKVYKNI